MEYFEQLSVGDSDSFGAYEVRREEVTTFAAQYDPQPVHTDPDAAAASMFGELVASGWHTAAMTMRLLVDHRLADSGAMGAVGVDELRWPEPVRPGDTLTCESEVIETDPGKGPVGTVTSRLTGFVDGEPVVQWTAEAMFEKRAAE